MSDFGNLLTTGSSTVWSPFQSNANAVLKSHITVSGLYTPNPNVYPANYVTGSNSTETNAYGKALGLPNPKFKNPTNGGSFIMLWADNTDLDGSGSITFDLDQGIGRTEALDSFILQSTNGSTLFPVGGYAISASNNNSTWTGITSSLYYPGGSGIPTAGYDATIMVDNSTLYRYYKIMLLDGNGTYGGLAGIVAWDSTLFKNQINLLNPNEANVTGSFVGQNAGATSLQKLTSFPRESYGWYFDDSIGSLDINWGDGKKLIRGLFGLAYVNTSHFPGLIEFYKSETGELDSWEFFYSTNIQESQGPMTPYQNFFLEFGSPVKTQYLRIVVYGEGSQYPTLPLLMYSAWMYEMSSSQPPPLLTNVTASAFGNNAGLTWNQTSGTDNRLVDVIYNIERSSNNGSSYDHIITLSGSVIQTANTSSIGTPVQTSYVDSNLADGTYLYRIQSQNQHHLATSSFVTTSEVTVPVAGKKIWNTNKGNIMFNPNDTILIEIS